MVRYNSDEDWYVVKGRTGVHFQSLDITRISPDDFIAFLERAPLHRGADRSAALNRVILARVEAAGDQRGAFASAWPRLYAGPVQATCRSILARGLDQLKSNVLPLTLPVGGAVAIGLVTLEEQAQQLQARFNRAVGKCDQEGGHFEVAADEQSGRCICPNRTSVPVARWSDLPPANQPLSFCASSN